MIDDTGARNGRWTPRGQRARDERQPFRHDLPRALDVLPPLELDPDHGDADRRRRTDAPHARRPVQRRFDREGDQRLDLERVHARRLGQDRHGRRREIGQHIERNAPGRPAAPDEERRRKGDDGGPVAQRPANQAINHDGS
jgi:hypothetical protein